MFEGGGRTFRKISQFARAEIQSSVLTVPGQSLLVFLIAFHLRSSTWSSSCLNLEKMYISNEYEVENSIQSKDQNKAIFWFC